MQISTYFSHLSGTKWILVYLRTEFLQIVVFVKKHETFALKVKKLNPQINITKLLKKYLHICKILICKLYTLWQNTDLFYFTWCYWNSQRNLQTQKNSTLCSKIFSLISFHCLPRWKKLKLCSIVLKCKK